MVSDTVWVAVAAIIPSTIAAISSFRNARLSERQLDKLETVHVLVNSNLSAVKADLATANERIVSLVERHAQRDQRDHTR